MALQRVETDAIEDDAVTTAKIAPNAVAAADIAADAITNVKVAAGAAIAVAKISGLGTAATLENNIAILAFKTQAANNLAKFNLVDQVIDEYKDGTGATYTTAGQGGGATAALGYISSITTATSDAGGTLTDITNANTNFSSGSSNDNYGDGNDIGIDGSYGYNYITTSA